MPSSVYLSKIHIYKPIFTNLQFNIKSENCYHNNNNSDNNNNNENDNDNNYSNNNNNNTKISVSDTLRTKQELRQSPFPKNRWLKAVKHNGKIIHLRCASHRYATKNYHD